MELSSEQSAGPRPEPNRHKPRSRLPAEPHPRRLPQPALRLPDQAPVGRSRWPSPCAQPRPPKCARPRTIAPPRLSPRDCPCRPQPAPASAPAAWLGRHRPNRPCSTPAPAYGFVVPAPSPTTFFLDRSAFSVGRLQDEDSQVDYWLAQPAEQRLAALEILRESYNPDAYAAQRLRGFLEVTQRA